MRKKIVIFDWGGVLGWLDGTSEDWNGTIKDVLRKLGVSNEKIQEKWEEFDFLWESNKRLDDICYDKFVKILTEALSIFDIDVNMETIQKYLIFYTGEVLNRSKRNHTLFAYIEELRKECEIGLLSNLNVFDKPIQDLDVHRSRFDYIWLSCDMEMRKPNRNIYEAVMADIPDYDILFIDDREDNLIEPTNLGWQTFHMTSDATDECIECIKKFIRSE